MPVPKSTSVRSSAEWTRQVKLLARDRKTSSVPNVVTWVRTVLTFLFLLFAIHGAKWGLYAGWTAYWLGDMLDGFLARKLDAETRVGAVLDSACDRLCLAMLVSSIITFDLTQLAPGIAFGVLFVSIDFAISLEFLRHRIVSTYYYWLVDRRCYILNWSPIAKAASAGPCVILMSAGVQPVVTYALTVGLLLVKSYTAGRMLRGGKNGEGSVHSSFSRPLHTT